jgi:hypothetical protein
MTLVTDITAALPGLRAEAEAMMVDACTITHAGTDDTTFDPDTGTYTNDADSTVYTGPCQVQVSDGLTAQQTEAGGAELTVTRVMVKIPVTATGVQVGDLVTITTATNDADLEGQVFTVVGLHAKTFATSRRLQVERTT